MRSLIVRTFITNSGINAMGLLNSVLLARWLGPSGRGEIAAAMLWPGLLIYLSSMGLIVATTYFSSLANSKPRIVLNSAFWMGGILSGTALPIGFVLMPWFLKSQNAEVIAASRWYLIVIPISLLTQFGLGVLQGRMRIAELNWLRTIIPAGYFLGTIALLAFNRLSLNNIIALHLCLNVVVFMATLIVLRRIGVGLGVQTDFDLSKNMLSYGFKAHVGQISGLANITLDQVLMAAWLPPAYLGLYVVAVSSAGLSQMFAGAVQTVSMPSIAKGESHSERGECLRVVFRKYWILSIFVLVAMGAVLPALIPFVFGSAFRSAILAAEILLFASLFKGATQVLGGGAAALGNPWLGSKANLSALVITLVLLYLLLPALGIVGAAIATAAAYFVELTVVIYGLHRTHSISPLSLFRLNLNDMITERRWMSLVTGGESL